MKLERKFDVNLTMFSKSMNLFGTGRMLHGATVSWKQFKIAAAIPEVLISQFLDNIATPFQRIPHVLDFQELNGAIAHTTRCRPNRKKLHPLEFGCFFDYNHR